MSRFEQAIKAVGTKKPVPVYVIEPKVMQ